MSCKHRKAWIIGQGHYLWCYECGALRKMKPSETTNSTYPIGRWTKPTGINGDNPYDKFIKPLKGLL